MEMRIRLEGNKKVTADYKGMAIRTDQPVKAGGDGSAPSPFDLFVASLGTCAGFFVASFCETRKISPEGIELVQHMEVDDKTHLISSIKIEIKVPNTFPEKYYDSLIKAADQCTVKKHLHQPPKIEVVTTKLENHFSS